jgi:ABC-type transport system involved in multi-copper enzyme maturation permease subunit
MSQSLVEIFTIARFTVREALKNRVIWIAAVFAFAGLAVAPFLADVAITESEENQAALLAAIFRLCAVFVVMVFVISTIVREFNDKCLELYLSLPISRAIYFAGKLAGFLVCGGGLAAIFALAMLLVAAPADCALWGVSLACELFVMAAVSLFCVMTFNQQIPASLTVAFFFYLLARAGDAIVLISESEIIIPTRANQFIGEVVDVLFVVMPDLGRFTQTEWLIYSEGAFADLAPIFAQTVIYCALIGGAALFDFTRKNI